MYPPPASAPPDRIDPTWIGSDSYNGLRLCQVDTAIQERPLGEFARLRHPYSRMLEPELQHLPNRQNKATTRTNFNNILRRKATLGPS